MSLHDDSVRLLHMLDHAREAASLVKDKPRSALDTDRVLSLALVRLLEIVGEAACRISDETVKSLPSVQWREIRGLRNRLIHGYDSVDMGILWKILTRDLPVLITELEKAAPPNNGHE